MGTYDKTFPGFKQPNKWGSAIVNTGSRSSGGVHWLSFAYNPLNKTIYVFDPLGWSDEELLRQYSFKYEHILKTTAIKEINRCVKVEKNTKAVQCACSGSCGLFCVFFLACFTRSPTTPFTNPLMDIMHDVPAAAISTSPRILHQNQEILYNFLKTRSVSFRKNENVQRFNTKVCLLFPCV